MLKEYLKKIADTATPILRYIDSEKYGEVYTDLSYVSRYRFINQYFLKLAKRESRFRERLILGTDFPLDELLTDAQSAIDGMLEDFRGYLPIFGVNNFLRFIN